MWNVAELTCSAGNYEKRNLGNNEKCSHVCRLCGHLIIKIRAVELIIFCSGGKIIRQTGEIERYGKICKLLHQ